MMCNVPSYAQTAVIKNIFLQTGVKKGNQSGILSKIDFSTTGLKGITCCIALVLKNKQGEFVMQVERKFTSTYESSLYSDYEFFVSYDYLYQRLPGFTGTLTPCVMIRKEHSATIIALKDYSPDIFLSLSKCFSCSANKGVCTYCRGTGKVMISYFSPPAMCTFCYGDGVCGRCYGKGYEVSCWKVTEIPFVPNIRNDNFDQRERDNRRQYDDRKIVCPTCNGTGRCSFCGGRGEKIYNGVYYDCEMCHGTGHCYGKCGGRGYFY